MYILAIIAVEAIAFLLALRANKTSAPLHVFIVVNMLLIVRFGGWLADFGIGISNYGTIFYAAVMTAQYAIMQRNGWHTGVRCFGAVFGALALAAAVTALMSAGPTLAGNESVVATYRDMLAISAAFAFASFGAFITGQLFFITFYSATEHRSVWIKYAANMVLAQAIDSVVFFSLAFGLNAATLRIMAIGYIAKVGLGLLALPVLSYMRVPEK